METKDADKIFQKIQQGTETEQERIWFESWYWEYNGAGEKHYSSQELTRLRAEIRNRLPLRVGRRRTRYLYRVAAAASIILCVAIGMYFYSASRSEGHADHQAVVDAAPGGNRATLTLADGTQILLDSTTNGLLAEEHGMIIQKGADGLITYQLQLAESREAGPAFNSIATPRGGQYKIILADGTKVWLNAASSLRYPARFSEGERKVELEGEGYFEVAHRENQPFIVMSEGQEVEVLGTHFNIHAYGEEDFMTTTLLEGSIKVSKERMEQLLLPGQQLQVYANNHFKKSEAVNVESVIAWKDGYFKFDGDGIEDIMQQLARWYDIDVDFQGPIAEDTFTGTIDRSANLSRILRILEKGGVRFRMEGNKLIVISG